MGQTPKPAEAPKPGRKKTWIAIAGAVVVIVIVVVSGFLLGWFGGTSGTSVSVLDDGSTTNCLPTPDLNCKFDPASVTVAKGTTVTWNNKGGVSHTVTTRPSQPDAFDKPVDAGKSVSFTFNIAGTYNYYCTIHTWMNGTITVNP